MLFFHCGHTPPIQSGDISSSEGKEHPKCLNITSEKEKKRKKIFLFYNALCFYSLSLCGLKIPTSKGSLNLLGELCTSFLVLSYIKVAGR